MSDRRKSGFIEKKHTADFAIFVWAEDLETLFLEAVNGMFALMELGIGDKISNQEFSFDIEDLDDESLLVGFLTEILFLLENDEFFPEKIDLNISGNKLRASLKGYQAPLNFKEIKAVTYHELEILKDSAGNSVTIVFDV